MFKNWNTNDADLADFHGFWKILFENKIFHISIIISEIVLFTN